MSSSASSKVTHMSWAYRGNALWMKPHFIGLFLFPSILWCLCMIPDTSWSEIKQIRYLEFNQCLITKHQGCKTVHSGFMSVFEADFTFKKISSLLSIYEIVLENITNFKQFLFPDLSSERLYGRIHRRIWYQYLVTQTREAFESSEC